MWTNLVRPRKHVEWPAIPVSQRFLSFSCSRRQVNPTPDTPPCCRVRLMWVWTSLNQVSPSRSPHFSSFWLPPQDQPFLRTGVNAPSYKHGDASPLLHPVSTSQMQGVAALFTSCLVLTAALLRVWAQFTGTEMPCEDFSPSSSTPTSGTRLYTWGSRPLFYCHCSKHYV